MKLARLPFAALLILSTALADSTPPAKPASQSRWVFDLLPKAFQSNPRLEMTVITELTDAGRKRPTVSSQAPAYYLAHSGGYHPVGDARNTKPISAEEVERTLQRALRVNGYLPADAQHAPGFFVVYVWGPHSPYDADDASAAPEASSAVTPGSAYRNLLDRAALAGGDKFAAELGQAINDRNLASWATPRPLGNGSEPGSMDLGAAAGLAVMETAMNPVRVFMRRAPKNEFLVQQAVSEVYYVIASAYDYASVASNHRQLLWRTRMTVNALGVSQVESLPTLIASAAPYFGRDMAEPEVLLKRELSKAQVDIGDLKVVEGPDSSSAKSTPPAPPASEKK